MSSIDDAFALAQSLSVPERFELIGRLCESISPRDFKPSDADLAEVKRRCAEFDAGRMKSYSWEEVRDAVRRRISGQ